MKRVLLAVFLAAFGAAIARAQVSVPYPAFQPNTDILSSEMNANFSALTANALNRTGGTVTGMITSSSGGLRGTWTGGPTFSGAVTFSGNPTFSGTPVFSTVPTFSDGLGAIAATSVTVDSVGIINSSGQIPEISSTYFTSLDGSALTGLNGSNISSGTISDSYLPTTMASHVLTSPELTNYSETESAASISAGVLALDLASGNHFAVSLNANITSITFANVPPAGKAAAITLIFTADGTARTITWPSAVKWPSAAAPTMTSTDGKVDIITLYTVTGGTTWYGVVGGQAF